MRDSLELVPICEVGKWTTFLPTRPLLVEEYSFIEEMKKGMKSQGYPSSIPNNAELYEKAPVTDEETEAQRIQHSSQSPTVRTSV